MTQAFIDGTTGKLYVYLNKPVLAGKLMDIKVQTHVSTFSDNKLLHYKEKFNTAKAKLDVWVIAYKEANEGTLKDMTEEQQQEHIFNEIKFKFPDQQKLVAMMERYQRKAEKLKANPKNSPKFLKIKGRTVGKATALKAERQVKRGRSLVTKSIKKYKVEVEPAYAKDATKLGARVSDLVLDNAS